MIELKDQKEVFYDEAKNFLEEIKEMITEARKMGKKVVYVSKDLLIFSLEDEDSNVVYEVCTDEEPFASKLVFIGDKALKSSYLLNLIHKQELKIDPHYETHH